MAAGRELYPGRHRTRCGKLNRLLRSFSRQSPGRQRCQVATYGKKYPARSPSASAPAGVEPLGKVRRSQLISTYGIGAIVDLEKGSFMPMGLDDLDAATRSP